MTRSISIVLAASALVAGCSVVLDPSRHQDGEGDVDGGSSDAGPVPDGGREDAGSDDAGSDDGGQLDGGPLDGGPIDAGPPCPGALTCAAAAPLGWNGPVVLVTGAGDAAPPACPSMAPATAFTARSGLDAPAATCGCSCTPPPSGTMTCGSAQITTTGSSLCITIPTTHATIADGACMSISALPSSGRWSVSTPPFATSASGCTPVPNTTVPAATWDASHRACGFGTPSSCGDQQVCVPPIAAGERLCVWVEGDTACPAAFPARLGTAEDADDTRGCSACTCGTIAGGCGGHVDITNGCPGTLLRARIGVNSCTVAEAIPTPMSAVANFTPTASCPPSSPAPTGGTTLEMPRTVCCVE